MPDPFANVRIDGKTVCVGSESITTGSSDRQVKRSHAVLVQLGQEASCNCTVGSATSTWRRDWPGSLGPTSGTRSHRSPIGYRVSERARELVNTPLITAADTVLSAGVVSYKLYSVRTNTAETAFTRSTMQSNFSSQLRCAITACLASEWSRPPAVRYEPELKGRLRVLTLLRRTLCQSKGLACYNTSSHDHAASSLPAARCGYDVKGRTAAHDLTVPRTVLTCYIRLTTC